MRKLIGLLVLLNAFALAAPTQQSGPILSVGGAVDNPLQLTAADLAAMPREKTAFTDHDAQTREYEGVRLTEILKRAGAPSGEKLRGQALTLGIIVEATDGYRVAFTLGELDSTYGNKTAIVADRVNSAPLTGNEAPLRLIVPGEQHVARSVRGVKRIEVVRIGG